MLREKLTKMSSQVSSLHVLRNNNLLEAYKVWNMNRCFVLKNSFMGTLEVEPVVGSLGIEPAHGYM